MDLGVHGAGTLALIPVGIDFWDARAIITPVKRVQVLFKPMLELQEQGSLGQPWMSRAV